MMDRVLGEVISGMDTLVEVEIGTANEGWTKRLMMTWKTMKAPEAF